MKFLFHVGSPKAGSSFLQSVCARSRDELAMQRIYFPPGTAHDERSMLSGRISAGNARELAVQLGADRWDKVESWLARAVAAAEATACDRILISSEWLLGALADNGRLVELARRLADRDLGSAGLLLLIRDPVGQFISLYKHRAKNGTAGPVSEWAESGYRLPQRLAGLRRQLRASGVDLMVRQYGKQSGALERVFFNDWLGVPVPEGATGLIVNPSLSLSELVLIRRLRARHPGLVPYLYDRLVSLDQASKAEGSEMTEHARSVAASAVAAHAEEWDQWNRLLPESERFSIPSANGSTGVEPDVLELSSVQHGAMIDLLAESSRPAFLLRLCWSYRLRPALARLKGFLRSRMLGFSRKE